MAVKCEDPPSVIQYQNCAHCTLFTEQPMFAVLLMSVLKIAVSSHQTWVADFPGGVVEHVIL